MNNASYFAMMWLGACAAPRETAPGADTPPGADVSSDTAAAPTEAFDPVGQWAMVTVRWGVGTTSGTTGGGTTFVVTGYEEVPNKAPSVAEFFADGTWGYTILDPSGAIPYFADIQTWVYDGSLLVMTAEVGNNQWRCAPSVGGEALACEVYTPLPGAEWAKVSEVDMERLP